MPYVFVTSDIVDELEYRIRFMCILNQADHGLQHVSIATEKLIGR